MTLTKADIIQDIYENCGFSRSKSVDLAETIFELIKQTLESGENVLISSFGKFYVKEKNARKERNPQTGDDLMLDGRRVVAFKCSAVLMSSINLKRKLKR
jgi:integration host factor subunit alpha